jgi:hypothetical protein
MKKVCLKMVPRTLTPEQKETQTNICADILQNIVMNHGFFSMTQKLSSNPCIGRVPGHREKKHGKASQISKQRWSFFFSISEGLFTLLRCLKARQLARSTIWRFWQPFVDGWEKKPEMWKNDSWILHHDNTPAHNALSVKTFLEKHKIPVLEHPPYLSDLDSCDFFYFQRPSLH